MSFCTNRVQNAEYRIQGTFPFRFPAVCGSVSSLRTAGPPDRRTAGPRPRSLLVTRPGDRGVASPTARAPHGRRTAGPVHRALFRMCKLCTGTIMYCVQSILRRVPVSIHVDLLLMNSRLVLVHRVQCGTCPDDSRLPAWRRHAGAAPMDSVFERKTEPCSNTRRA